MQEHQSVLKGLFPAEWGTLDILKVGLSLKLHGLDWRSIEEFAWILAMLEMMQLIEWDGEKVRAAAHSLVDIFEEKLWPDIIE